jgi:hypothetical protein
MFVYVQATQNSIPQKYKIINVDTHHQILEMEVIEYGNLFVEEMTYPIIPIEFTQMDTNGFSTMIVKNLTIIVTTTYAIPNPDNHLVYFVLNDIRDLLNGKDISNIYLSYKIVQNYIVITSERSSQITYIDYYKQDPTAFTSYSFIKENIILSSLNVPNGSILQNSICMQISLESLILPNDYIKGQNILLSFLPYVIVQIYNVDSPMSSKFGQVISNNTYTMNAQFICPIGNVLNPKLIRFVEVNSNMTQTMKFNLGNDIFFQVLLPNGKPLEYIDRNVNPLYQVNSLTSLLNYSLKDTVACIFSFSLL